MRVCLMIEGQEGVTWDQWVALAGAAQDAGFEALFRSDHYLGLMGDEQRGSLDAWATLTALAAVTDTIRLGTLVSPATFRHPSELAKVVATADIVSGGRVELGLGAGWNDREHAASGFDFPPLGTRMELFEEQLEIVRRQWTEDAVSFDGRHYRLDALTARPRPVQDPCPPIVVGGHAGPRSVAAAARWADEYNVVFPDVAKLPEIRARVDAAWADAGRDGARLSLMAPVLIGTDEAALRRRGEALKRRTGNTTETGAYVADLRQRAVAGTPGEIVDTLGRLGEAGVDRVMLQHLDHADLGVVEDLAEQVIPRL